MAIGLGSNLGDRLASLGFGVERLGELLEDRRCSSLYETEPMYVEDQPTFLNLCCVGRTRLAPGPLLERLLAAEEAAGRSRTGATGAGGDPDRRYGPRRLDLDLLLYGRATIDRPGLTVPHPGMTERGFVLVPLAEVAADWLHPGVGRTIGELARGVDRSGVRRSEERLPGGCGAPGGREAGDAP